MSRSVRTAGNETVTAPSGDASGAYRISARADRIASFSQVRARSALGLRGGERARVSLEKRHVRAEAADGHLYGQRAAARHRRERASDQRRFAVPARRDQEDLLAGVEIGDQPVELGDPIDERRRRHDFAVDERVAGYGEHGSDYVV